MCRVWSPVRNIQPPHPLSAEVKGTSMQSASRKLHLGVISRVGAEGVTDYPLSYHCPRDWVCLQLFPSPWRSNFESYTWSVWWPAPSRSYLEVHNEALEASARNPRWSQASPSWYPRAILGCLLLTSWRWSSLSKPRSHLPQPRPFLSWICCASPSSCRKALCGSYLHYTNSHPCYKFSFCECVLNCMKIPTSLI